MRRGKKDCSRSGPSEGQRAGSGRLMFERYSVISWQIDADISFNGLEYGPGTVPSSCSSQARGPSCCHNCRSFAVSLVSSDQALWTPDCTTQELRLPQQPPEAAQVRKLIFSIWIHATGSPWVIAFFRRTDAEQESKTKESIAKERGSRLIYVNASSVCSDYYLWLDHLVLLLFHPSHFTDGKSEARGREVPGQVSHGESQAEWRLS